MPCAVVMRKTEIIGGYLGKLAAMSRKPVPITARACASAIDTTG
jgi:hypothetical protein